MYQQSIKTPRWKRIMRKTLSIVAAITMILNFGMANALFIPQAAHAAAPVTDNFNLELSQWADKTPANWQHGNLNSSNSGYHEGESVPFMLKLTNLTAGTDYTIRVRYDFQKGGDNAYDYLTTFDRSRTPNPIPSGTPTTIAIPADSTLPFTQVPGEFSLWGGFFAGAPTGPTVDVNEKYYDITLHATAESMTLLWGGHLAAASNWGVGNGASSISGSPFHEAASRILNGKEQSSQDRSIQPGAILPGICNLVVKKSVDKTSAQPGDELTYTINYENQGTAFCTGGGVKIYDEFKHDTGKPGMTFVSGSATINVQNDQDLHSGDPAPELYAGFDGISNNRLGNLHEIGPGEKGTITFKVTVNGGQACDSWKVWNTGWTNGNELPSDVKFQSEKTTVTTPCNGSISGYKWKDINGNGIWDAGEPGLQGWHINLGGDKTASTTTAADGSYSFTNLNPGNYTVSETQQNNWVQTYPGNNLHTVTLAAGQDATGINFGNKPKACNLDIIKSVDKTDAQPGDTLTYTLVVTNTGDASCTGGGVRINDTVPTGTTFVTNSQTQTTAGDADGQGIDFGYLYDKFGGPNPTGFNGSLLSWNAHVLSPGEQATVTFQTTVDSIDYCTKTDITNKGVTFSNELPNGTWSNEVSTHITTSCEGTLKVVKYVDSGSLAPDNWDFTVGNDTKTPAQGTNYVEFSLPAGTYTATESSVAGYHQVSSTCDNVQVIPNQKTVCEFHNTRDTGTITVNKYVYDENGRSIYNPSDWYWRLDSDAWLSGGTMKVINTNQSYTVAEDTSFYSSNDFTTSWSCLDLSDSNATVAQGTGTSFDITATYPGQNIVCTFTNVRDTGWLKVIKHVVKDNGGTANASDWPIHVFSNSFDVTNSPQNGSETGTYYKLPTGTYTVGEDQIVPGYSQASIVCDGQNTSSIEVVKGEQADAKVCTITNDDEAPSLTLVKKVTNDNGSNNLASEWTLTAAGDEGFGETGVQNIDPLVNDATVGPKTVKANTAYTLSESGPDGYSPSSWSCEGDGTFENGAITLTEGGSATCTITNDDEPGRVVGYKFEDIDHSGDQNGNEGGLVWTFYLRSGSPDGTIEYSTQSDTSGYFEFPSVDAGTYYLTEKGNAEWDITVPVQGYYEVVVTPGYDNSGFCEPELETFSFKQNAQIQAQCGFLFGNAEKVTLSLDKYNDQQVDQGGDGILETNETINYHIDWGVSGNSIATNVVLVDHIPSELNLDVNSISNSGVWDANARTITWDFGTQNPGATGFVMYSATVIVPIANGTLIHNVARISADNSDPQYLEDDSDVTVESNPDLSIVKTVDVGNDLGFVNPGDTVEYTIVVSNTGTDTTDNVVVNDTLPDGFLYADTLTPTRNWSIGDLAAGETSDPIVYNVIVGTTVKAGFYDNIAVARADNHSAVQDDATVEVRVPKREGETTKPILTIDKTVNVEFVNPEDTITYTVVVKNIGDGAALNATLTDSLPAGFTFEDGTTTRTWSLGTMQPGAEQKVVYNVNVGKDLEPGQYLNFAVAKADNHKEVSDVAPVEVRTPRVLGESVPNTGASLQDLIMFLTSILFIVAGAIFIREGRKNYQVK